MSAKRRFPILLKILTAAAVGTLGWIALQQTLDHLAAKKAPAETERLLFSENLSEEDKTRLTNLQRTLDRQVERQLLRAPVLAVEVRPIPQAENGYFQLIQWLDQTQPTIPAIPSSIQAMREFKDSWDEAAANSLLAETEAVRAELHRIGSLRESSASGVTIPHGLHTVQQNMDTLSSAIDLLILEAEASLRLGNDHAAFVSTRTAVGIAYHIDHHEHASFLHATAGISGRERIAAMMTRNALPLLVAAKAPLDNWSSLIRATNRTAVPLDRLARGEWLTGMYVMPIPDIYSTKRRYIPDPDIVIDLWTDHFCRVIAKAEPSFERKPQPVPEFSKQGHAFLTEAGMTKKFDSWISEYDRSVIQSTLAEAAFALAQLESQGKPLSDPATLALLPIDPSTEAPFPFDTATRTLSSTAPQITPIVVPARP